jgi:uncharacterized protein with beta-barrel porin domain
VGKLEQKGGTHKIDSLLTLGYDDENSSGTYLIQDGTLEVGNNEYVGSVGTGIFEQSGGNHVVTGQMVLGLEPNAYGSYIMSGGTLTVGGDEIIDKGVFEQTGGQHTIKSSDIGKNSNSHGTYILTGGILNVEFYQDVGDEGAGIFVQDGGEHNVNMGLRIGSDSDGQGNYTLSDGSLSVGWERIGYMSTGTFEQAGGIHTIVTDLRVGQWGEYGNGTFLLNGGTLSVGWGGYIGERCTGNFKQSGGQFTIDDDLKVGIEDGDGKFELTGGDLLVRDCEYIGVQNKGVGYFIQSGGEHTVNNNLILGTGLGSNGSYTQSGGKLWVGLNEYIGNGGIGIFSQQDGTHIVTSDLIIANGTGSSGTYDLEGGSLSAENLINNDTFNYSGGNLGLQSYLINNAIFNLYGEGTRIMDFDVTNEGIIMVHNDAETLWNGTLVNNGEINNNGTVINDGIVESVSGIFHNYGKLKGAGQFIGNFVNDGYIAPGSSIGTITFSGSYTQNPGTEYEVEVDAAGNSDLINVIGTPGTATINGGLVNVQAASGAFDYSTDYIILLAENGVSGTFDAIVSNLDFLVPSLTYNPNNVLLNLTHSKTYFSGIGQTFNELSVGTYLDTVAPNSMGDMRNVINSLCNLSETQARSAFNQMGGGSHTAYFYASFSNMAHYLKIISNRMHLMTMAEKGSEKKGVGMESSDRPILAAEGNNMGDMVSLLETLNKVRPSQSEHKWEIWIDGYGIGGGRHGNDVASRYDYSIYGKAIGFDFRISDSLIAGISAGYSQTDVDFETLNDKGELTSYEGAIYASYICKPWYLNSILSYALDNYDTTRGISFGNISRTARADYEGHEIAGYLEGGYTFDIGTTSVQPIASLSCIHLYRENYTETGADALNLMVNSQNTTSIMGAIGTRLARGFEMSRRFTLSPEIRAQWFHEFLNDDHLINASFTGSTVDSFTVKGDKMCQNKAALGGGFTGKLGERMKLFIHYDMDVSDDHISHAVKGGLVVKW